jgi:di/tripeptidase
MRRVGREVETTRESILDELEDARQIAREAKNGSAMAMATLGKAKVCGLIIDRREVGDVGAFDHLTDEELVEEAKKRAEALGLPPPKLHS